MKKSIKISKAVLSLFLLLFFVGRAFAQDVYEIKFTVDMTQYRAALVLYNGSSGLIRVKYYNDRLTRIVEQKIVFEKTTMGNRLTGYNPVYPGTTTRYPNYVADNFYVFQDEYGKLRCVNIDDKGNTAVCYIRLVTGSYAKNAFLRDFNWKLN